MEELTINEALCILRCGWSNEVERELTDIAWEKVRKVSKTKHLKYQLHKVNLELNKLK